MASGEVEVSAASLATIRQQIAAVLKVLPRRARSPFPTQGGGFHGGPDEDDSISHREYGFREKAKAHPIESPP